MTVELDTVTIQPNEIDLYQKRTAAPGIDGKQYVGDPITCKIGLVIKPDQTSASVASTNPIIDTQNIGALRMWTKIDLNTWNLVTPMNIGLGVIIIVGFGTNVSPGLTMGVTLTVH